MVEIELQREVSVRGPQVQVDQVGDGSLLLSVIILMNLGTRGCLARRREGKKWCWLALEAEDG